MESKRIDLKKMRERIAKRKSRIANINATIQRNRNLLLESLNREKFYELLDSLPVSYTLKLRNTLDDFDGNWRRTILDGQTAWQREEKILLNPDLFPLREGILHAFENRDMRRNLLRIYYPEDDSLIDIRKKGEITRTLTQEKLQELYCEQNKSLGDIGSEFGCTRPTVMKLMKKYGIERRTKSKAMIEAIKIGKFERFEYHEINEKFFSKWSAKMAWVLGLLFTDGTIDKTRVAISSIDFALLKKVKKLLNSSNPIAEKLQSYDKSKHIYEFNFYREKMRGDLNKLGLHQRKSLNMIFPKVPEEYIRHFIRGCWDGDGSIFFEEHKLIASYISGSKIFIERLVEELYKVGIYKKTPPYEKGRKRILLPIEHEIWSKYPNGRFPLTLHMKNKNAYYIKIQTRENVEKLFHFFYDSVDESMYLSRKYEVFVKGLKLVKREETGQLTLDLDF